MSCKATEQLTLKEAQARLPAAKAHAESLVRALRKIASLPEGSSVLDVGAAQGRFLIHMADLGFNAWGVEPWSQARDIALMLSQQANVNISIVAGKAENLPFDDDRFDLVHASSVIEHVQNPAAAFREAHRVLKKGGVYWFFTASSMCPRQQEIKRFPLFGWYPDTLKRRIMLWARDNCPRLVGMSGSPALNWFTPSKARRMLRDVGFEQIYDRWDLASPSGVILTGAISLIRRVRLLRLLGNVCVSGCAYAAIKT